MKQTIGKVVLTAAFLMLGGPAAFGVCTQNRSLRSVTYQAINSSQGNLIFKFNYTGGAFPSIGPLKVGSGPTFYLDPSGNPVNVPGAKWRTVDFSVSQWTCSVFQSFGTANKARKLRKVVRLGQFEGKIEYVFGLKASALVTKTASYACGAGRRCVKVKIR